MLRIMDDFSINSIGMIWSNRSTQQSSVAIANGYISVAQRGIPHSAGIAQTIETIKLENIKKSLKVSTRIKIIGTGTYWSPNCAPMIGFVSKNATRETTYYQTTINKNMVIHFNEDSSISLVYMNGFDSKTVLANSGSVKYPTYEYFDLLITLVNSNLKVYINKVLAIDYKVKDYDYLMLGDDNIVFEICVPGYNSTRTIILDDIAILGESILVIPKINTGYLSLTSFNVFKNSSEDLTISDFGTHGSSDINMIINVLSNLSYEDKYRICIQKVFNQ